MAWRIGDHVVSGELWNTRRNSVNGWLEFAPDEGIRLELTGNFEGELAGKHFRFKVPPSEAPTDEDDSRLNLNDLEVMQSGGVGDVLLRIVKIPRGSIKEFYLRSKMGEPTPVDEKPCLYLEWYSQNGRVVAEIVDPQLEFVTEDDEPAPVVEPEPLPDADAMAVGPEIIAFDEDGVHHVDDLSFLDGGPPASEDDPYQLFPSDLERQISESVTGDGESAAFPSGSGERSWDEVIPGIDEETKQMYEQWDEIFDGEKDEPLATLFDPPMSLKRPEHIADEEEAEALVKGLLTRLATYSIALDMCEHFTALDAYRLLVDEILSDAHIHPNLTGTGFVQHYSTWEHCPTCEAEFDAEWEQRKKEKQNEDGPDDLPY
ncbi:MAG: hypothetical protein CMJ64_10275 [Planctomycetaceae bacterium]|nr:hypothetical protein [Planctomycetaceae bacterium]